MVALALRLLPGQDGTEPRADPCPAQITPLHSICHQKAQIGRDNRCICFLAAFLLPFLCFYSNSTMFPSMLLPVFSSPPACTVQANAAWLGGRKRDSTQLWLGSSQLLNPHQSPCLSACICKPVFSTLFSFHLSLGISFYLPLYAFQPSVSLLIKSSLKEIPC